LVITESLSWSERERKTERGASPLSQTLSPSNNLIMSIEYDTCLRGIKGVYKYGNQNRIIPKEPLIKFPLPTAGEG